MSSIAHQFYAMGSDCAVHLQGEAPDELWPIALAAEAEVRRIEKRYSRYSEDSDLSHINVAAARGESIAVDDETAGLIDYAFACYRKSDGLFDISAGLLRKAWNFSVARLPEQSAIDSLVPRIGLDKVVWADHRLSFTRSGMEVDFGGIGKEYAADRAADICRGLGARHGFINLGGDIRIVGSQDNGSAWRFGIRHPRYPDTAIVEVHLAEGALATSGSYERFIEIDGRRYCHILNPKTGWPSHELASVTVIANRCLPAGTLSTIAMLRGRDGVAWLRGAGVRHVVVGEDDMCSGTEPPRRQTEKLNRAPGAASAGTDEGSSWLRS